MFEYVPSDNLLVCVWFISRPYENQPAQTWNMSEHSQHGPYANHSSSMPLLNKMFIFVFIWSYVYVNSIWMQVISVIEMERLLLLNIFSSSKTTN